MRQLFNQLGVWWCVHMHDTVMWPSHGKYRCRTCLREYVVDFEQGELLPDGAIPARIPLGRITDYGYADKSAPII